MNNIENLKQFIMGITESCDASLTEAINTGFDECFGDALTEGKLSQALGGIGLMAASVFASPHKDFTKTHTPEQVATIVYNGIVNGSVSTDKAMETIKKLSKVNAEFANKTLSIVKTKLSSTSQVKSSSSKVVDDVNITRKLVQDKNGAMHQYKIDANTPQALKNKVAEIVTEVMGSGDDANQKIMEIMSRAVNNNKKVQFLLPVS